MKTGRIAALLLATALSLGVGLTAVNPSQASDLDPGVVDGESSRFVRIGHNKSVVVKLPAEVRDVVVGNPDIVDAVVRSKNTAYLFARQMGQTNVFFFDADGNQILALDLEVAVDVTAVKKLINRTLPGNQITVDSTSNNIVLGGIARNALEARTAVEIAGRFGTSQGQGSWTYTSAANNVINTMTIAGEDQVLLKVKVVEIQRDVLKQFGINFTALIDAGKFAFNLSSINPFSQGLLSPNGGYKGNFTHGNNQIQSLIRAMESDGLVRTLAEPNLTAMTGESASFLAGGEFPYQNCSAIPLTTASCTTTFKSYGVSLQFTPTVLSEGRINLKITTAVSDLGASTAGGVPSLTSRQASTTLELPSGGSMMLAGLIRESTRQNINGTPGLKKLPVLGSLFRSRDFISNETELVIFVTPYLVRPTGEQQLTSPDQGYNPATDKQAIIMGRLNKVYGGGKAPDGDYHGNIGFIVE